MDGKNVTDSTDCSSHHQFAEAKRKQKLVYRDIGRLLKRINASLISKLPAGVRVEHEKLRLLQERVDSLQAELKRKKMKVSMFGSTSSGKTMTVNAMIGRELLPSGMGDTTSCFVQIEGVVRDSEVTKKDDYGEQKQKRDSNKREEASQTENDAIGERASYFSLKRYERGEKEACLHSFDKDRYPLDKERIAELVDASAEYTLNASYIVEIYLDTDEADSALLSSELQIMDCPGITICKEIGDSVKDFCADSDVHVFIVNPKTVMSPEEKKHFVEVGRRLTKPDIIVGFSQWDLAARERRPEKVIERHIDEAFKLLSELGTVTTRAEAEERCFFYSGMEALDLAIGERDFLIKGWEERHEAFQKFVSKIKERASMAGMQTKLRMNRERCSEILTESGDHLSCIEAQVEKGRDVELTKINHLQRCMKDFSEGLRRFKEDCENHQVKALGIIDEEVTRCMQEVSDKMLVKSLRMNNGIPEFEEDRVTCFAQEAILRWYKVMLEEFKRATDRVCQDFSIQAFESYRKHFCQFNAKLPELFDLDLLSAAAPAANAADDPVNGADNAVRSISVDAVRTVLTGIGDRAIWASFATTRRRLSAVQTNDSRNVMIRTLAGAAAVFFISVRRWIRESVEKKIRQQTSAHKDDIICPDTVKEQCASSVKRFCESALEYYTDMARENVQVVLENQLKERQEQRTHLDQLSAECRLLRNIVVRIRTGEGDINVDIEYDDDIARYEYENRANERQSPNDVP